MKKKTNKILPKAQYAGGMGPDGIYPGELPERRTPPSRKLPERTTPPPRGLTYTEDAAPLREGYITPQQWVNTWNSKTNSYDRILKPAVRDPKFVNRENRIVNKQNRMVNREGTNMKKGGSLRRQVSIKGLRTSRKHK